MEKLRQAIRELEAQAEKYERHLGAERFPAPGDDFFAGLASDVDDITAELQIPEPKPVKAEDSATADEPGESSKPAGKKKGDAVPKS